LPREIHARAKRARADAGAVMDGGQSRGITLVGAHKTGTDSWVCRYELYEGKSMAIYDR
jgi:hypothetical protein